MGVNDNEVKQWPVLRDDNNVPNNHRNKVILHFILFWVVTLSEGFGININQKSNTYCRLGLGI